MSIEFIKSSAEYEFNMRVNASPSNGPKFEASSALFKASTTSKNDGAIYKFGKSHLTTLPKEQEGLNWDGFHRNNSSLTMDSTKIKAVQPAPTAANSKIFGDCYKNYDFLA